MNPRNTDSVLRHLDFAFFDTVTLQLSLILMYWITGHSGFIYQHERYWLMSMAFMFGQFAASMFADVYQKVFTRDLFAEFKALLLDIGVVLALGGTFLIIISSSAPGTRRATCAKVCPREKWLSWLQATR